MTLPLVTTQVNMARTNSSSANSEQVNHQGEAQPSAANNGPTKDRGEKDHGKKKFSSSSIDLISHAFYNISYTRVGALELCNGVVSPLSPSYHTGQKD